MTIPSIQEFRWKIRDLYRQTVRHPLLVLTVLLLCLASYLAGGFMSGYLSELGRRCAEKKEVPRNVKAEVQNLLQQINPEIVHAVLKGDAQMRVWISTIHLSELKDFAKEREFARLLSVEELSSGQFADGRSPDGAVVDTANQGQLTECMLSFGDALRK